MPTAEKVSKGPTVILALRIFRSSRLLTKAHNLRIKTLHSRPFSGIGGRLMRSLTVIIPLALNKEEQLFAGFIYPTTKYSESFL
ncbi:hypothetical protein [Runella rosea]|uniref:hypothetical protein n=1 Tax=Runella rosea TaxID=2259595 RepID=UPI0013B43D14|nr:hypothetical protein [Runella rosea]